MNNSSWDPLDFLKGPPTSRFRNNLRDDLYYVTSMGNAGFTNQFMGLGNLIYLAMLSNRIPILPAFAPHHHLPMEAGVIPFGDLFDLPYLRTALQMPILEWRDVKALPSASSEDPYSPSEVESIGCWAAGSAAVSPETVESYVRHVGLDVSYTHVPSNTRTHPENFGDHSLLFAPLAALIHPSGPSIQSKTLPLAKESPNGSRLPPDILISCFERLYYVVSVSFAPDEWGLAWSPAWNFVGQHLRFTEPIKNLAKQYLRAIFDVPYNSQLPPFIAVHIRRGDMNALCNGADCYQHLSTYEKAVKEIQDELLIKRGIFVKNILVASDETNLTYWKDVNILGWKSINHTEEMTNERYGLWYPILIDSVAQSLATGFVGTFPSTFSMVSQRRVDFWNDGVTRMVSYSYL
ncbi:hypothetical protein BDQ12DRAFT_655831 [Crucibulum laeve]|uniref:O-fucosyltransferase family protein n=1 Tax=Crucibulum laeve TaxID=68775 RepID=A0A5C3LS08_9AGAR|nr:hypothetical protein BDQ12DRAFT_655831 [Crucibulum laeve]